MYLLVLSLATATAADTTTLLGRAALDALGAELLTRIEVVRYREAQRGAQPWLIDTHLALEGSLLDGDVLLHGDDIMHAEAQRQLIAQHTLLEGEIYVSHIAEYRITSHHAVHIHTAELDKVVLGERERELTIGKAHEVAAQRLVGIYALTHIHTRKVEICRPPLRKLEREVHRGVVVVQRRVVYTHPDWHQQSLPQSRKERASLARRGSEVYTAPPSPIVRWWGG